MMAHIHSVKKLNLHRQAERRFYLSCWIFICLMTCIMPRAEAIPSVEYQVKASLVFNFLHFIAWPEGSFVHNQKLAICMIGDDLYGSALLALQGETVNGKIIAINKIMQEGNFDLKTTCQVILFAGRYNAKFRKILLQVNDSGILTIGEGERFLENGGIIGFNIINDTVRFDINLRSAKLSGFVISSKLLRLANKVLHAESGAD